MPVGSSTTCATTSAGASAQWSSQASRLPALLDWLRGFGEAPRRTFVAHGEPAASAAFVEAVERELGWSRVEAARPGVPVVLE